MLPFIIKAQFKEPQTGDTTYYKTLIPETKQTLLKNMSMIANFRVAERNEFKDGQYTGSRFKMEQFRLEIKGQITDKVYSDFAIIIQVLKSLSLLTVSVGQPTWHILGLI